MTAETATPQDVLKFWFPEDLRDDDEDSRSAFFASRMHGDMDTAICANWGDPTTAASDGALDDWADTPEGRLALILLLDQFPRSLWRGTPDAYGQDLKTTRLALEGIRNGHYRAIPQACRRVFYQIAIGHCEGPDHADRMALVTDLSRQERDAAPEDLQPFWDGVVAQTERVLSVIQRFGRHPHRNAVLGRRSTPAETAYIAEGDFPHERSSDDD